MRELIVFFYKISIIKKEVVNKIIELNKKKAYNKKKKRNVEKKKKNPEIY